MNAQDAVVALTNAWRDYRETEVVANEVARRAREITLADSRAKLDAMICAALDAGMTPQQVATDIMGYKSPQQVYEAKQRHLARTRSGDVTDALNRALAQPLTVTVPPVAPAKVEAYTPTAEPVSAPPAAPAAPEPAATIPAPPAPEPEQPRADASDPVPPSDIPAPLPRPEAPKPPVAFPTIPSFPSAFGNAQ